MMNLNQITFLIGIFIFFFTSSAIGQDLHSKSNQELEQMKQQAVIEQDFELAEKIKLELQSRKSVDELIEETRINLDEAVKAGEYAKADQLKRKVERLEAIKMEIRDLEIQMEKAVKEENYASAKQLKEEINQLKASASDSNIKDRRLSDDDESNNNATIIFKSLSSPSNLFSFGILIDGRFAGEINREKGLTVDLPPGQHELTFLLGYKKTLDKATIAAKPGYTYEATANDFDEWKRRITNVKFTIQEVSANKELENPDHYNHIEMKEDEGIEWDDQKHVFNYSSIDLDVRGLANYTYGLRFNGDYSLSRDVGLYAGYVANFAFYTDLPDGTQSMSLGPSLTYYFMNHKQFVPYTGLEAPITWLVLVDPETYSKEHTFNAGANWRIGSHYFFTPGLGLSSQLKVGFTGGWAFQVGVSFRGIPKNRREPRYLNAYYYGY